MVCLLRQQIDPFGKTSILRSKIGYGNIRRKLFMPINTTNGPFGKNCNPKEKNWLWQYKKKIIQGRHMFPS